MISLACASGRRPPLESQPRMQRAAWAKLLHDIPPALHENVILTTSVGGEIALKTIIHADGEFLVIRGRITGTTDGFGFFVIPFERLSHVSFQKAVTEEDIRALFQGS